MVEAVFESMELKKEVMVNCDKYCKDDCILATNTSTLDIDEVASVTERPDKVSLKFWQMIMWSSLVQVY